MTIDPVSLNAFRDEVEKIAGVMGTAGKWVRRGWQEAGEGAGRGGWFGKPGTWRKNLPIGGKSLTVAGTASMVPGAVAKKDPIGRDRSKAERLSQVAAGTLGGLAGVGAVMKPGGRTGLARTLLGGVGGAMGGEYLSSLPFRKSRIERAQGGPLSPTDRQQLMRRVAPQEGPQ